MTVGCIHAFLCSMHAFNAFNTRERYSLRQVLLGYYFTAEYVRNKNEKM